jgi:hypothetical protein
MRATLRVFQALCACSIVAVTALARPAPPPPDSPLWVSILGEEETVDGLWRGHDVLAGSDHVVDRFQVSLRPDAAVLVELEAVTADGVQRLYPKGATSGRLEPGQSYSLPGPRTFFEVRGEARLRLRVRPADATGSQQARLRPLGSAQAVRYPLSDGSAASVLEQSFAIVRGATAELEWQMHGR